MKAKLDVRKIDEILKQKGWSHSDLARKMGVTRQHVSLILRVNKSCNLTNLAKLSVLLGIGADKLLKKEEES